LKASKIAVGVFFIIGGILFFVFLRELSDPEIEGDSGRIGWDTYYLCFIPIIIGLIILFFQITSKKSN